MTQAAVQEIVARHQGRRGALLPLLHDLQEAFGQIEAEAVPLVARALNLSRAEVEGVISFYRDFRRAAAGRHIVTVCRAEACQAVGAEDLVAHLQTRLRLDLDTTAADGSFTLASVYCLGNCALGPSLLLDGQLHGRVTPARADALLAEVQS